MNKKELIITKDLTELSDEEIFELSLKKPAFFEIIVNRYKNPFLRKATPIISPIGNLSTAEDLVQETFVKIYIKGNYFTSRGKGSFKSWAYAVLINTCYSAYKKAKKEKTVPIEENPDVFSEIPNAYELEEGKTTMDFILSAISRLPETLKKTAEEYFLKEKTHKEIALSENTTEGAIRTRIHRAREMIKNNNEKFN